MDEILLRMKHELPFNNISTRFPEAKIYRWCNSMVDYLEILASDASLLNRVRKSLPSVVTSLHSELIYSYAERGRFDAMVRCRCTPRNSTVRITEGENCLWKPPVLYENGTESLTVLTLTQANFRALHRKLSNVAAVEIVKKTPVSPDVLRDSYTLSLSGLFAGLTRKQIDFLLESMDGGYFDIPKRTSMERLAARAKISESTLQEHLSKGESKLIRALAPYLQLYRSSLTA